jgi:hypothetical protein
MKKITILMVSMFVCALLIFPTILHAQDKPVYTTNSVWNLTFVKLKPNVGDDYLKGISKTWKASMDEMASAKLIKSYKILLGDASNEEDFDLILMIEYPNFAAFDANPERDKKIQEIEKKIKDGLGEDYQKTISNYSTLREITGSKVMSEIILN